MDRLPSILKCCTASLLLVTFSTGCGAKREIDAEMNEVRTVAIGKRTQLKASEAESYAVGNLGRYNMPKPEFITELKDRVASLKRDGTQLQKEREEKAASLKQMEDELAAYQAKFPPK